MLIEFKRYVKDLQTALEQCEAAQVDIKAAKKTGFHDYKTKQKEAYRESLLSSIKNIAATAPKLHQLADADNANAALVRHICSSVNALETATALEDIGRHLDAIATCVAGLHELSSSVPKLKVPSDIRAEVDADLEELDKCFQHSCYRSVVILCGRLLETALHRKYFEVTGNDLLEKAPGTGLGNLIAKLNEKGQVLDPGLANQIHLINQVRVFSVHKKQQPFNPSAQQAQAIMLYTFDVVSRLFS